MPTLGSSLLPSPRTLWQAPFQDVVEARAGRQLTGPWRLLLLGDGSPTRHLQLLTGDPVRAGDQPTSRPVNELEAVRLLQQVAAFNQGLDPVSGLLPDGPTSLFAGAAADPQSPSWSGLKARIQRKQAAGARFVQTQMVMDAEALRRFVGELAGPLGLPVLAGVFLLKSARNALFINRVVPGARIPQAVIDRLAAASNPADEGISIAAEQVACYRGIAQGVHIMAVKAEERIPLILERSGLVSLRP
jgi:methylenetetrahydrofolate reductase (NADPH)